MDLAAYRSVFLEDVCTLLVSLGDAVLLQCKGKRPLQKRWQKLTLDDMTSSYVESLRGCNIGVSLGDPSRGLCTIDLDTDEASDEFLKLNPSLADSLQTRGARGRNIWVRIDGAYPPTAKLRDRSGAPVGEWRASGSQTIISGIHPISKKPYTALKVAAPLLTRFEHIQWPADLTARCRFDPKDGEQRERRDESLGAPSLGVSLPSQYSPSLHYTLPSLSSPSLDMQKGFEGLKTGFAYRRDNPDRWKLFQRLTRTFKAEPQARNHFITQAVKFLYTTVCESLAIEFSELFYDLNQALFRDSRDQHMHETVEMIKGVKQTFIRSLSPLEGEIYALLSDEDHQAAFRICRDLAAWADEETPPPFFFLALGDLGTRICRSATFAQSVMKTFLRHKIIELITQGTRYAPGEKGVAARYRYCIQGM